MECGRVDVRAYEERDDVAVSLLAVCDDVEDDEAHRCDGGRLGERQG